MKPLTAGEIYGNWATLLLPLRDDERIDYGRLSDEIDRLLALKVNGIYSNGTAGEFYNQSEAEFDAISDLLARKCAAAGMSFQIGCSHPVPIVCLERVKRAVALQPGAIQVTLPDWIAPSLPETIDYLRRIAEAAAPVGLVLYNPPHARRVLRPEDFHALKKAGIKLAGCKTGGGDAGWYAAMRKWAPGLSLFVPGHHLATGLQLGARGAYSNVACLHPGAAQQWYKTMLTDQEAAIRLQSRIQVFMTGYILPYIRDQGYSPAAADKFLAAIGGWADIGTRLRWPYRGIPTGEVLRVRKMCRELLPEFFPGSQTKKTKRSSSIPVKE